MSAKRNLHRLGWQRLHWRRPLEAVVVRDALRLWSVDPRAPKCVLELRADGAQLRYLLGVPLHARSSLTHALQQTIPGTALTDDAPRDNVTAAGSIRLSSPVRPLRTDAPDTLARAVLVAMDRVRKGEELVLQVVLGPRRSAKPVPSRTVKNSRGWAFMLTQQSPLDSESRSARRAKQSQPAYDCVMRLGVSAGDQARRRSLIAGLFTALRTAEAPGARLRIGRSRPAQLDAAASPWRWPMTLNIGELCGVLGWPIGNGELPGIPGLHPVPLPPDATASSPERVVAQSIAPGTGQPIGMSVKAALHATWGLGPTGAGKSTWLASLLTQDLAAGRGAVLVEPKSDLTHNVLSRVPEHRLDDIVVLDPSDAAPVGLNPLAGAGPPETRVDGLLSVFQALFGDSWGPRTQDIMHACLLTLARRGDASLVMVPLLLTNPSFRRSMTRRVAAADPVALAPFWAWYEALSDAERGAAIAPVMNKLRAFLLHPRLRAVIGQRAPRFDLTQVLSQRKVLLVPLRRGVIGSGAARMLGSLVVAQLWSAVQARAALPEARRSPVMVYIDEVQDYLHLPTDLGEALAQSRGLGVGWTVTNQFLAQLPRELLAGILGNVRSRVLFGLAHDDASVLAKGHPELTPQDITSLGRFEVYVSLLNGGQSSPYVSGRTLPLPDVTSDPHQVWSHSQRKYGRQIDVVEQELADLLTPSDGAGNNSGNVSGRRRRTP